jgi:aminoglycoside 6-adenylyltransferase
VDHRTVLQRVIAWARHEDTIRVVVLTGSVARGDGAFDELSDLDLELYVSNPSELLNDDTWYEQFGEVLVVEALENPDWHPTRLVYYADGKIEFMVAPTRVLGNGVFHDRPFQLLLDKDNVHNAFRRQPPMRSAIPTTSEFLRCVHWFYAAAMMWAKYLVRDDPWAAKLRDWDSKKLLLKMVEWDHKARKGWDFDTWYLGARLRGWADPELVDTIDACWSGLSRQDSAHALLKSLSLFEALSTRTARALGIEPFNGSPVRDRIERILATALDPLVDLPGAGH